MSTPIYAFWDDESTGNSADALNRGDMCSLYRLDNTDVASLNAAATAMRALPVARRCMMLWSETHDFEAARNSDNPADFSSYVAVVSQRMNALARMLPAMNVLCTDWESANIVWTVSPDQLAKLAAELKRALPTTDDELAAFDDAAMLLQWGYFRQAIFLPFHQHQPTALLSEFTDELILASDAIFDANGHRMLSNQTAGNVQSPSCYGTSGDPFAGLVASIGMFRKMRARGPILPWISGNSFCGTWHDTGYWQELVRQLICLCGPQALVFNADQPNTAAELAAVLDDYHAQALQVGVPMAAVTSDNALASACGDRPFLADQILGRVSFPAGITSATVQVDGHVFKVTADAGAVGAWFSWAR